MMMNADVLNCGKQFIFYHVKPLLAHLHALPIAVKFCMLSTLTYHICR
jgi:hypothetical protein